MAADNVVELVLRAVDATGGELQKIRGELAKLAGEAKQTGAAGQEMGQGVATGGTLAEEAGRKAEEAARKSRHAWQQFGLVAAGVFAGLVYTIKQANDASNQLQAAQLGLEGALRTTGQSADEAKQFLQSYVEDGLMTIDAASQALQNLLIRYRDLETAEQIMVRLKDAAAFNKQAHLTMDQAVKSATEGLKNENSILVDNAGVTKNVSVMWKEYAAQLGKGVGELTEAEKHQAEFNGIMRETEHQLGNAAKLSQTAAGAQALLSAETLKAKQAIGQAFEPAIRNAVTALAALTRGVTFLSEEQPRLTAAVIAGTTAFAGLIAAIAGVKTVVEPAIVAIKGLTAAIFGLELSTGNVLAIIGALAGGVALLAAASNKAGDAAADLATKEEEAVRVVRGLLGEQAQAAEQAAAATEDAANRRKQAMEDMRRRIVDEANRLHDSLLSALRQRYQAEDKADQDALKKKQALADEDHQRRLRQIEEEGRARLASIQGQIDALDELSRAQDRQARDADRQQRIGDLQEELNRTSDPEQALRLMREILNEQQQLVRDHERDIVEDKRRSLQQQIEDAQASIDRQKEAADRQYQVAVDYLRRAEDARKAAWEAKMEEQALEAEVEQMVLANNQEAMLELLRTYDPEYFNQGKSFGERMIDGLLGTKPDYEKVLASSISMMQDAGQLIKKAGDLAEADAQRAQAAAARIKKAAQEAADAWARATVIRGAAQEQAAQQAQEEAATAQTGGGTLPGAGVPKPAEPTQPSILPGAGVDPSKVQTSSTAGAQKVFIINGGLQVQTPSISMDDIAERLETEARLLG